MSNALWEWKELCAALGLPQVQGPDISGISLDSRTLEEGALFVAVPGDPGPRFHASSRSDRDGHEFVDAAVGQRAGGVLVREDWAQEHRLTIPQLPVADTIDALWALGRARRSQLTGPVIAVTGSSGKTTAKSFLAAAVSGFATAGSLNNYLGVPLSLARTPRAAGPVVVELGMNHPGEIAPLASLASPDVALVVNVGSAHQENFSDLDGIRREKLSIVQGLTLEGVLVVHDEVDTAGCGHAASRMVRFGTRADSQVRLIEQNGAEARYRIGDREVVAQVPGGGWHRALTLAGVLAVVQVLARPLEPALELSQSLVPAGRGRLHRLNASLVIDDSYNANPASMAAALEQLLSAPPQQGDRYAVLGQMAELGERSATAHAEIAAVAGALDGVWLVGEAWSEHLAKVGDRLRGYWPELSEEASRALRLELEIESNNISNLLIKGSNSVFWKADFVPALLSAKAGADG